MKIAIGCLFLVFCTTVLAVDLREIELRRLLEPTPAELRAEASGRIYIFDGLRYDDITHAMDEEFERIDSMMFIRTKKTTESGEIAKDPNTGEAFVEDDGC